MVLIFLLLTVGLVSAGHSQSNETYEDYGEYGHYTTWRKAICEGKTVELMNEMEECFKLEPKEVLDATVKCTAQVVPSSEGHLLPFMDAACTDIPLFHKFDDCFEEYEEDPEFLKLLAVTPEMEECYENIFEKYAMDSLKNYLKNFAGEEK